MTIHIKDLKFKAIIGILKEEREKKQRLIVDLKIKYTYKKDFLDYVDLSSFIKKFIKKSKFLLIEDAIDSLIKSLYKRYTKIEKIYIKITKPDVLNNAFVSVSRKI